MFYIAFIIRRNAVNTLKFWRNQKNQVLGNQ